MNSKKQARPSVNATSLITRAAQILALFITLALAGMVSSIIVSEKVNDNAAKINMAGSLRMLAARASVIHPLENQPLFKKATLDFQRRFDKVRSLSRLDFKTDAKLALLFNRIESGWIKIRTPASAENDHALLATDLDDLVNYFQQQTEADIRLLRIIQYIGIFMMICISYIIIYRSQSRLITPFKQLVLVANQAGQRNFSPQADEQAVGELGLLAKSLNEMSKQLSLTYQSFEQKVAYKTKELEQTNRSLSILYRSAHSLSSGDHPNDLTSLLTELEKVLADGKISLSLVGENTTASLPFSKSKFSAKHVYPIDKHGQDFGSLIWQTPQIFNSSSWQGDLLRTMASLIATSSYLTHKRHTDSRLEIMEERSVIARELHDSLAQSLSYLKLQISLLNKQFEKGLSQQQISPTIAELNNATNLAYKQLREILTTFRLKLGDDSIEYSLQETVNEFSAKCGYTITFHYELAKNLLKPHQEIHLLQIIREALSNIHKHAQASSADVNVTTQGNKVSVVINDNGCGFSETNSKESHFGLKIMQERAKSLDGSLQINQKPPHGTQVSLHFNLIPEI